MSSFRFCPLTNIVVLLVLFVERVEQSRVEAKVDVSPLPLPEVVDVVVDGAGVSENTKEDEEEVEKVGWAGNEGTSSAEDRRDESFLC